MIRAPVNFSLKSVDWGSESISQDQNQSPAKISEEKGEEMRCQL